MQRVIDAAARIGTELTIVDHNVTWICTQCNMPTASTRKLMKNRYKNHPSEVREMPPRDIDLSYFMCVWCSGNAKHVRHLLMSMEVDYKRARSENLLFRALLEFKLPFSCDQPRVNAILSNRVIPIQTLWRNFSVRRQAKFNMRMKDIHEQLKVLPGIGITYFEAMCSFQKRIASDV